MRQLAITGFFAIALLSGCAGGGGGSGPHTSSGAKPVTLPCPGKDAKTGDWPVIDKKATQTQTLRFHTDARCKFTDLQFDPPNNPYPPGFSKRVVDASGEMISYEYSGKPPIPDAGYPFTYTNDYPQDGNGSGVIKSY